MATTAVLTFINCSFTGLASSTTGVISTASQGDRVAEWSCRFAAGSATAGLFDGVGGMGSVRCVPGADEESGGEQLELEAVTLPGGPRTGVRIGPGG